MSSNQHAYINTLVIDGQNIGVFDRFRGGAAPRGNAKRRHGGQIHKTVHPGLPDYDNVTVDRNLEPLRDQRLVKKLLGAGASGGEPLRATVQRQPTRRGVPTTDPPITYHGWVENCVPGDIDSDSDDLLDYSVELTVERVV